MINSPDEFEAFFEKVRAKHLALGVKKGTQMLNDTELEEVWDRWAHAVLAVRDGKNPIQIQQRLAQLGTTLVYLHQHMQREESKTATYKLAEARKKRQNAIEPRKIGR